MKLWKKLGLAALMLAALSTSANSAWWTKTIRQTVRHPDGSLSTRIIRQTYWRDEVKLPAGTSQLPAATAKREARTVESLPIILPPSTHYEGKAWGYRQSFRFGRQNCGPFG